MQPLSSEFTTAISCLDHHCHPDLSQKLRLRVFDADVSGKSKSNGLDQPWKENGVKARSAVVTMDCM